MGTTSEELKKLYTKLGGKDPKVAGFSAPGEILNAINELPLPTEYELPTVTTEDTGDVLVVNEEGHWDKGEAGSGVTPNPEGEATADLTKLGIDDTVYGIPKELPAVTGSDNGNILQVVQGAWAKAAMSKETVVYNATHSGTRVVLSDNKTRKNLADDFIIGKRVIIKTNYNYYLFVTQAIDKNNISVVGFDYRNGHQDIYLTLWTPSISIDNMFESNGEYRLRTSFLPKATSTDAGKTLIVDSNGYWTPAAPPASLPEVTAADNGDVLTVVNGAWAKAEPSGGGGDCVVYTAQFSSGQAILDNGTISEIAGITSSKAVFIICRSGSVQGQNGLYYYSGRGRVGAAITENTLHFSKVFRYYNGTSNEIVFSELTAYVPGGGSKFDYGSSILATT